MLHVAHVDVDSDDVVERAAGFLHRGLEVLAHLPGLRLDVADAGDAAVGAARRHAGEKDQAPARLGDDRLREMPARLAQLARRDLLFHGLALSFAVRSDRSTPARRPAAI